MSTAKRRTLNSIENLGLDDDESDNDTICYYESDVSDESVNLSSDELSSESEESESDSEALADVRVWCAIDLQNPTIAPPRFPFSGQPGLQVSLTDCNDPLEYLRLFLDDEFIDVIVKETNRYAEQTMTRTPQRRMSRTRQWEPVTKDDIWLFIGILVLQSVIRKPQQHWYWSHNRLLETPIIRRIMSEYRFSLIMKFLHFCNNDDFDANTHPAPKLKKIWEVYQMLLHKFQSTYTPQRDLSIDESMMAYKGRLGWVQYIPSKRARFGVKFFTLCESQTGYIWNSIIYCGKGTTFNEKYAQYGLSMSSVLSLVDALLGKGYCVTVDNFYTSPELLDILIRNKTDAYGTVRSNRRNLPSDFTRDKLKKGEVRAWQKGKMLALRWRDKKDICLLSTVHNATSSTVKTKGGKDVQKPNVIVDYNHTMGGVDKADQELTFYPIMRKQQKRYYKKIFRHLLEQCLWNAYVLFVQHNQRTSTAKSVEHADFMWMAAERIFADHQTTESGRTPGRRSAASGNPERLTGRHFPEHIPATAAKKEPTRTCVVCCSKRKHDGKKVRKESRYYCPDCDVGLCVSPCFRDYHTKVNY